MILNSEVLELDSQSIGRTVRSNSRPSINFTINGFWPINLKRKDKIKRIYG